jgi:tetratricopeptide (TPR) repeat protein
MRIAPARFRLLCALLSNSAAFAAGNDCLAHHAAQRYAEAVACYQKLPPALPWTYLQGDAALALHLDPSPYWKKALDYLPARLRLAEWLTGPEALPLIQDLLRRAPDSPRVHYLAGKRLGSLEHLEKAVALEPRYGQAHYELALALRRAGRRAEADHHFAQFKLHAKTAIEIEDPVLDRVRALQQTPFDQLVAGKRAEESGRLADAIRLYRQAPSLVQAHVNLISVHGKLGQFAEAEASFAAAVALEPNVPAAYYNYGVLLMAAGRRPEAETQLAKAAELNPRYADALNNLGLLLQARGELPGAEARFRAALAAQPQHPEANCNLARLLARSGSRDADRHFAAAVALPSERAPAYHTYFAQHYKNTGRLAEAIAEAQAAQTLAETYGQKDLAAYLGDLLRQWRQPQ